MVVTMEPGVPANGESVAAVVRKAQEYGLNPDVKTEKGKKYVLTQVFLRDGSKTLSASVPEHIFRGLPDVNAVVRVTPPRVSVFHRGNGDHHKVDVGGGMIGTGLPCLLVAGPCTVDTNINAIAEGLAKQGIRRLRGGCWKPRSSPYSFPGFGEKSVQWLLRAAKEHNMSSVFTEVMESSHIDVIRRIKRKVRYHGTVVLWVGARTANPILLRALGAQLEFPVMVKNSLDALGVDDLFERAEWVLSGNITWGENGDLDPKRSLRSANHHVILCLRGTRQTDRRSPWRFNPNHHWTELVQSQSWAPVAIDPSHSAGNRDLVYRNIKTALSFSPSLLIVEGGYPAKGFPGPYGQGFCDVSQMVPAEHMCHVSELVTAHNVEKYRKETF